MSEWFEVKDADNVDLSDDGKFIHILFQTNRNGNRYVELPVEMVVKLLAAQQPLAPDGANEPEHTGIPETCKHPECVRLFQSPAGSVNR